MTSTRTLAAALLLWAAGGASAGEAAAPAQAASAAVRPASAPGVRAGGGGGELTHTVIEDQNVRIEETRWRGQVQRISVQSKLPGAKAYEIIVGPGGRDPSQDHGTAGQAAWSLFSY